jgi:hypothetical protein
MCSCTCVLHFRSSFLKSTVRVGAMREDCCSITADPKRQSPSKVCNIPTSCSSRSVRETSWWIFLFCLPLPRRRSFVVVIFSTYSSLVIRPPLYVSSRSRLVTTRQKFIPGLQTVDTGEMRVWFAFLVFLRESYVRFLGAPVDAPSFRSLSSFHTVPVLLLQ